MGTQSNNSTDKSVKQQYFVGSLNTRINNPAAILLHNEDLYARYNEAYYSYALFPAPQPTDIATTHLHYTYEMLFFYDGDADCNIAGTIYHLKKNDLLLIKPSTFHNVTLHSSHPYERIVCNFQEDSFPLQVTEILKEALPLYHIPENHPILQLFDNLRASYNILPSDSFEKVFCLFMSAILIHLQHLDNSKLLKERVTLHSTFHKILFYIDENPEKPLSLFHLSQIFYLSESHIAHLFKKHLNVSATQYIHRKKITYAQSLIVAGMPPAQVAEKCSYESYPTFYRQYKKMFGVPPNSDYNRPE